MTLSKREKRLLIIVGVTGAVAVIFLLWQFVFAGDVSYADLQVKHANLTAKLEKQTKEYESARRAAVKLDDWQRRSLPSNVEVGRKLYQNWLRETVDKASFRGTKINAISGQSRKDVFEELRYTIKGQASLQQLTQFLYDFYRAGHLHKISNLQITPPPPTDSSKELDLTIIIEALALNEANSRDKLTSETGDRLLKKSFDDYKKMIVDRNVFAAYTPPKPKEPDRPRVRDVAKPKFEHLEFTKLTAIIEIDGQPQAWIETKTTGKSYKAREGEELDIASAKVKVLHIGLRDVELQVGEEKRTIALGQNLLAKP